MEHDLYFSKSIERWDEAIPLGNGRIGALVWGKPKELRFSLDRTDIWDRSQPVFTDRTDFTYENLIRLVKEKDIEGIRYLFDTPYNTKTPTKLPAGKILLSFPKGDNVVSQLKLQTAEASFAVELREGTIKLTAFCHAVTKSGMIRVEAPATEFQVILEAPPFGVLKEGEKQGQEKATRDFTKGSLKELRYPPGEKGEEGESLCLQWFVQPIDDNFSYSVLLGTLKLETETLLCYRVLTSRDGKEWLKEAKEQILKELNAGYEKQFLSHKKWWEEYWKKSSIHLPDVFFEKNWFLTNYLFASASRKGEYPMPLQGVWMADDGQLPPWKGDYHNDLNTQLCYTHFYKANHWEEGESFLDFLWSLRGAGREFAERFYGTKGCCLPGVMTIDGKPLGGWPMYSLVPVHQIWLCLSFDRYYRYTQDMQFLKEKAWVYFQETAECISALLEEKEGKLYLPISSSPELHDDEVESWVTPNSNYDLSLLHYLYKTLEEYALLLQNGTQKLWREYRKKLPKLAVNEDNVLMISPDESLRESHRHLSNAMPIWPLEQYSYEKDKAVIDATILDYEKWGSGMWVGFSFVWMSHLYICQGNGEGAYEQLRIFWESFCSPNGFHLNGDYKRRGYSTFHYRPFTLEGNMCAADALQEMLLQTGEDGIKLFYAVPESWKEQEIAFENFRGCHGLTISAVRKPHEGYHVFLKSPVDRSLTIKVKEGMVKQVELKAETEKEIFIKTKKNKICV